MQPFLTMLLPWRSCRSSNLAIYFHSSHRKCHQHHRLISTSNPLSSSSTSPVKSVSEDGELPINNFGVPLIPENLRSKIFSNSNPKVLDKNVISNARSELMKFGLIDNSSGCSQILKLPDVTPYLPNISNQNISDHLWRVASEQVMELQ